MVAFKPSSSQPPTAPAIRTHRIMHVCMHTINNSVLGQAHAKSVKVLEGAEIENLRRVLSYVEEFRMQAKKDEEVYVEGNLEQVISQTETFQQITLTYGPRYYEQVLKVLRT